MIFIQILSALALDQVFGEARRWHPLVGFGRLATACEKRLNPCSPENTYVEGTGVAVRLRGVLACLLLVLPAVLLLYAVLGVLPATVSTLLAVLVLYFCVGYRSLIEHCQAVATPLAAGDLAGARHALSMIVSRDTAELQEADLARGTLESLLENGSDAVFAPLFWFAVGGAPAALAHRLVNTLDAMWGYRSDRYQDFGWCAARLDDVMNWVPARLCALCYALAGNTGNALSSWSSQAAMHDSPNAGPVMASGAGALDVALGGTASYRCEPRWRPQLGIGRDPTRLDIEAGIELLRRALLPGLGLVLFVEVLT